MNEYTQVDPVFATLISVIVIAFAVVLIAAQWRIFTRAGEPGWAAILPFYNQFVLFRIAGLNPWLFLLLFVPIANIVVTVMAALGLGRAFGKGTAWSLILLWLFSVIGYLILGYGRDEYRRRPSGPVYA